MVSFFGAGDPWVNETLFRSGLTRLGLDIDAMRQEDSIGGVDLIQGYRGVPIARAGFISLIDSTGSEPGTRTFTTIEVGDYRDMSETEVVVTQAEALEVAGTYVTCAEDWKSLDLTFVHSSFEVIHAAWRTAWSTNMRHQTTIARPPTSSSMSMPSPGRSLQPILGLAPRNACLLNQRLSSVSPR